MTLWNFWRVILRLTMGIYWLYFSSQKWFGFAWVLPTLTYAAENNPFDVMRMALSDLVIPNWQSITATQTVLEAVIGLLLLIGLLTRLAGILGALLSFELLLTFIGSPDAPVIIWFYLFSAVTCLTVAIINAGEVFALDRPIIERSRSR